MLSLAKLDWHKLESKIPHLHLLPKTEPGAFNAAPPPTKKDDVVDTYSGGEKVTDSYRWLEDQNSAETRGWLEAQNQYTRSALAQYPGKTQIHDRLEQLLKVDSTLLPAVQGGRCFYGKRLAGQDQFALCMRDGENGKEEILVDPNALQGDHRSSLALYNGALTIQLANNGKLLCYSIKEGGKDEATVKFMDVDAKTNLPDELPSGRYDVALAPDGKSFYYSKQTDEGPRLYFHKMGTDTKSDPLIFGKELDAETGIAPQISSDGKHLLLTIWYGSGGQKTELYHKDLAADGPVTPLVKRINARFTGEIRDGHLYMVTNLNAPNRKVVDVDLANPSRENWREIIPEGKSVLDEMSLVGGKIFANYLENASSKISEYGLDGRHERDIALPTLGTATGVYGESNEGYYAFQSFAHPRTIYKLNTENGSSQVWSKVNVPIKSDDYEVKQVWYPSKDGTKIPMFLVHKKGLELNGKNPVYLTGYGGFNNSETPYFSAVASLWVENGGIYAVPNLRGGGEFGEKWHEAGMLQNKQNVFDDFDAAAEWLVKNRYTNYDHIAIEGGSNGGLLVGAEITQHPDHVKAAVCTYPLLDMLRYQKFLVAKWWVPEYGSSDNPKQFDYLKKYSPYQNVVDGVKYPATMFVTGDSDTRVAPLHARKMTARMQAAAKPGRPILLHYDTLAGHSAGAPLSQTINEASDELAFLFWQLGMEPPGLN